MPVPAAALMVYEVCVNKLEFIFCTAFVVNNSLFTGFSIKVVPVCDGRFLIGLMKVPLVDDENVFPEAFSTIEFDAWVNCPAEFPMAMAFEPWLEKPAEFPMAIEFVAWAVCPALIPIAMEKFA